MNHLQVAFQVLPLRAYIWVALASFVTALLGYVMQIDWVYVGFLIWGIAIISLAVYAHIRYAKALHLAGIAKAIWESPCGKLPAYLAFLDESYSHFRELKDAILNWVGKDVRGAKLFNNLGDEYFDVSLGKVMRDILFYFCAKTNKKPEKIHPLRPRWLRDLEFEFHRNTESDGMNIKSEIRHILDAMNGQD